MKDKLTKLLNYFIIIPDFCIDGVYDSKRIVILTCTVPGIYWKIYSVLKCKLLLQIHVEDKLLDQNGRNFDTKNVNIYSLRLDQFQIHDFQHL